MIFRILIVLVALSGLALNCQAAEPQLAIPTLDGKTFTLADQKGKVVIVHFWATWCPSCLKEMPALDDFYIHHKEHVEVIAVSVERAHSRDKVISYMHDFHMQAGLIGDATTNNFDTPNVLPVTYIIDTHGVVSNVMTPDKTPLTKQTLESIVLPLLGH